MYGKLPTVSGRDEPDLSATASPVCVGPLAWSLHTAEDPGSARVYVGTTTRPNWEYVSRKRLVMCPL